MVVDDAENFQGTEDRFSRGDGFSGIICWIPQNNFLWNDDFWDDLFWDNLPWDNLVPPVG